MTKKFFRSNIEIEDTSFNLTPLIDVLFVILITFILIAPVLKIDQISLASTGVRKKALMQNQDIQITLKKDGSILVNKQNMNLLSLEQYLQKYPSKKSSPQVFIDQELPFFHYQKMKDLLESCGFEEMDVVLQPK